MRMSENAKPLSLPPGKIRLIKDNVVVPVNISEEYVIAAVDEIKKKQDRTDFKTQAEIVETAIAKYGWGLGQAGYRVAPK